MQTPLALSADLRKQLHPRRALPGTAQPMTAAAARRALAKARELACVKGAFGSGSRPHAAIFASGSSKVEPTHQATHEAALALLRELSEETVRGATVDVLAATEQLVRRAAGKVEFLGAIAALRGVVDAVRVLHRASAYGLTAASGGWTTAVWLTAGGPDSSRIARALPVRHALCAAPDAEYAEAVALAASLREGAPLLERATLAFAFPDEPWANLDLAESQRGGGASCAFLLSAASDVEAVRVACARAHSLAEYALDLAMVLPPSALVDLCAAALPELLKKPKYGPLLKTPPRQVAQALACVRTPEAAAALAPYGAHAVLQPIVLGYFRDAPELAVAAVEGKGAQAVRRLSERRRAAPAPSSAEGETPALLRDRPWRTKPASGGGAAGRLVAMAGLELAHVAPLPDVAAEEPAHREMNAEELAAWRAETWAGIRAGTYACADYALVREPGRQLGYRRVPDVESLEAWNTGAARLRGSPLALVRAHGLAALPGLLKYDWFRWMGAYEGGAAYLEALMALVSPASAPRIARVAARRKKFRRVALGWLAEHAEIAALGLVPDALGPVGEARTDAEAALRFLADRDADAVARASARYDAETRAQVAALLARDPLAIGAKPAKRPPFLREAELPPVALVTGGALGADGRDALLELLQSCPLDPPYPGLARVHAACAPGALEAFAAELVEQWVLGDAPGRHEWMLFAAVVFPSEASGRRLGALAREWARKHQEKAKRACSALARLADDRALMHLAHIAETTRFDALRQHARDLVLEAAEARGLSPEELGDRTLPDLGLARDGTLALSYGARALTVSLDEALRPLVRIVGDGGEPTGATSRSLPRPTRADDPEAVKVAKARFDALRADLDAVADRERRRMEAAMTRGRAWPLEEFRALLVAHPLAGSLVRRLVWTARTSAGERTFRVAEDGSFADASDAPFAIPAESAVRIAHPVELPPAEVAGWAAVFADYAILQPFEQLGRATFVASPEERAAMALERIAGRVAPAVKVMGLLESRGFRRESAGEVGRFLRPAMGAAGAPLVVRLTVSPGCEIASLAHAGEQTTTPATLEDARGRPLPLGELCARDFSELVRDASAVGV
ncbi:MAG TPA: DUF4132 domain-containing protein [Polyangiaceae bacterium]|nr:DUF4132 domain-containing protein [Polyangiaceae bacterium]